MWILFVYEQLLIKRSNIVELNGKYRNQSKCLLIALLFTNFNSNSNVSSKIETILKKLIESGLILIDVAATSKNMAKFELKI